MMHFSNQTSYGMWDSANMFNSCDKENSVFGLDLWCALPETNDGTHSPQTSLLLSSLKATPLVQHCFVKVYLFGVYIRDWARWRGFIGLSRVYAPQPPCLIPSTSWTWAYLLLPPPFVFIKLLLWQMPRLHSLLSGSLMQTTYWFLWKDSWFGLLSRGRHVICIDWPLPVISADCDNSTCR